LISAAHASRSLPIKRRPLRRPVRGALRSSLIPGAPVDS
jgi:hypothetical protein